MKDYLVIGTYADNGQRFAEVFRADHPATAEVLAEQWAEKKSEGAELEVAGVIAARHDAECLADPRVLIAVVA